MRFGSLFSGIGGFDLGLKRAGHECAWQVEIDAKCRELLAAKWPNVRRYEDVREVGAGLARVDLICGGFPCQDLSVAGGRAGLAGERSGLWHEFRRILGIARPRWCLIENVPGLLSSHGGRDFGTILSGLVELGYGVSWRVLDAQFAGLAQRRKRVFIVGSLGDGRSAEVLFEPASVRWDPPPRREARERLAPSLANRARGGGGLSTDAECDGALISHGPEASDGHHGRSSPRGDGCDNIVPDIVGQAISAKWAKGSSGPSGDECANLLAAPIGVRRLTPRECSRLQGFPDDWTAGFSDSTRYKMLGNAVAVPVAEWIGRRLPA